jgi:hypothetical protein
LTGSGSRPTGRRTRDDFLDSFDSYEEFLHSYGLKPWDYEDVEMGERIIETRACKNPESRALCLIASDSPACNFEN